MEIGGRIFDHDTHSIPLGNLVDIYQAFSSWQDYPLRPVSTALREYPP